MGYGEIYTKSTVTQYRSGDILHAEFTATKTTGMWTAGPVADYVGQVSDDRSSAFDGGAINVNRYNIWAVGASLSYNFGPAQLTFWALDEVSANASGGTPQLFPGTNHHQGRQRLRATLVPPLGSRRAGIAAEVPDPLQIAYDFGRSFKRQVRSAMTIHPGIIALSARRNGEEATASARTTQSVTLV